MKWPFYHPHSSMLAHAGIIEPLDQAIKRPGHLSTSSSTGPPGPHHRRLTSSPIYETATRCSPTRAWVRVASWLGRTLVRSMNGRVSQQRSDCLPREEYLMCISEPETWGVKRWNETSRQRFGRHEAYMYEISYMYLCREAISCLSYMSAPSLSHRYMYRPMGANLPALPSRAATSAR